MRRRTLMAFFRDLFIVLCLPFRILFYILKSVVLSLIPYSLRTKKHISGEVAVVTGGASGIGREVSIQLAKKGARVVLWDINADLMEKVRQEIADNGGEAFAYVCDVSSRHSVYETAKRVAAEVGDVSLLVNNAGIINGTLLLNTPDENIERCFQINLLAHIWTIKAFLPGFMERNKGQIVTISSAAAHGGICKMSDYCASKAAVNLLQETVNLEVLASGKNGVKFTLVCPYLTNTGLFAGARSRFPSILPVLEPEYVGKMIVQAILLEERYLILPSVMRFLVPIYRVLPAAVLEGKENLFGAYTCMENFTGRTER